ncbi:hypothetical protein IFM89_019254 [Coptis chinensis]|uniref:BHLH domain-containing protein n=1 Tax=Coptis chinensis TaxID=261450 RepID=A0A835H645_9MAGN|nr:hypothetical protein IFM89_019254 [Coptis chinensis]
MALAKERTSQDSHMSFIQGCSYLYGGGSVQDTPNASLVGLLGLENYHKMAVDEENGDGDETANKVLRSFTVGRLPSLTDSTSNQNGIMFGDLINSQEEEAQIVINFKAGYNNSVQPCGPLLNFELGEDTLHNCGPKNRSVIDHNYQWNQFSSNNRRESRLSSEDLSCFETTSSSNYRTVKDNQLLDEGLGWFYSDGGAIEGLEESTGTDSHKRSHMGSEIQCRKMQQLLDGSKKLKSNKSISSKDPQSIAAKNRRERISERLKTLQDLVPNGSKVDLVTMLEKAISYVKFLQLQVKVLATDEFWPAQGGKAPEVSQVKEAIDAILSSHKDRNSSSK